MDFVNAADFEEYARRHLPKQVFDYYSSGATDQQTLKSNVNAFKDIRIRPRVLKGVTNVNTATKILGDHISSPILIAPSAMQKMCHPLGELATAKASGKAKSLMCLSSLATASIEDVAAADSNGLYWFQLYIFNNREITKELVQRAEKAHYKAIVLTVDTPVLGRREDDVRNGFTLPPHLELANFSKNSILGKLELGKKGIESGLMAYIANQISKNLQWDGIAWLRSVTKLPIVVKGIHTREDAIEAIKIGVDAIWVSNHGARQLDGVLAAINMVPEIIQAVQLMMQKGFKKPEVYMDGGIRRGADVFKALALGVNAVFLGRPILWALAAKGEEGVLQMLGLLNSELQTTMILAGCATLQEISLQHITKMSHL